MRIRILAAAAAWLLCAGCAPDPGFGPGADDPGLPPEWPETSQGPNGPSQPGKPGDLPCEVAELLQNRCLSCHADPPRGAPMPLATRAHLMTASYVDPGQSFAQRSVVRMRSTTSPMPPGAAPTVPEAEIAALEAWIAAGTPEGTCGTPESKPDPIFDAPVQCSSKSFEPAWSDDSEDDETPLMQPGRACITCHKREKGKEILEVGGTVYPTAHEPDLCRSPSTQGAIVEITDANKKVFKLTVNRNGNFSLESDNADIARPYTARLLHNGKVRPMNTPQTSGDCNSCHTRDGANGAPGRIVLP